MMMQTSFTALLPYQVALFSLAFLCTTILVQGILAGVLGLARSAEVPGRPLKGDHPDFSFRVLRTYANGTENFPAFIAAVLLAIFIGGDPQVVNWLAAIHVAFRMAYWAIYYRGAGKAGGGLRTIAYTLALAANLALSLVVLWQLAS